MMTLLLVAPAAAALQMQYKNLFAPLFMGFAASAAAEEEREKSSISFRHCGGDRRYYTDDNRCRRPCPLSFIPFCTRLASSLADGTTTIVLHVDILVDIKERSETISFPPSLLYNIIIIIYATAVATQLTERRTTTTVDCD